MALIDWIVKKTKVYKKLKFQFDINETHIARLQEELEIARANDYRNPKTGQYAKKPINPKDWD